MTSTSVQTTCPTTNQLVGAPAHRAARPRLARLSLRQNVAWTVAGKALFLLCQAGTLVVLARLGGASVVGSYALALAIAAPLFMLADFQLRSVQASDAKREYEFHDYLALRCAALTLALGCTCVVGIWLSSATSQWLIVVGVALGKSVEALQASYAGLFQQQERMDREAAAAAMRSVLGLATLAALLASGVEAGWALIAAALVRLVVTLSYDARQAVRLGASHAPPRWTVVTALAWTVLPLGAVSAATSLISTVTRYVFVHWHGEELLAFFAIPSFFLHVSSMLITSFHQAALPRLASAWRHEAGSFRRELSRMAAGSALFGVASLLLSIAFGSQLLSVLFGAEYGDHNWILVALMASSVLLNVRGALYVSLVTMRALRVQALLATVNLVVAAALGLAIIPTYGLAGITFVMFMSALVGLALTLAVVAVCACRREASV